MFNYFMTDCVPMSDVSGSKYEFSIPTRIECIMCEKDLTDECNNDSAINVIFPNFLANQVTNYICFCMFCASY